MASVRSIVAEVRSGQRPRNRWSAVDSGSTTTSFKKADVSRYATLPFICTKLGERLRWKLTPRRGRQR
jgi:hypothetical protein